MTTNLSWQELATLKPGALVAFGADFGIRTSVGPLDVPAGTVCKIVENGILKHYTTLIVSPIDKQNRALLTYAQDLYDGCIVIDDSDGIPPSAGVEWSDASPFVVRHYAHFKCYLAAGKKLSDLHAWQVGEFPFRLLKEYGLEAQAFAACSEVARAAKPVTYFNVTMEVFDGQQYGMLTLLCVEADTEEEARQKASRQAIDGGAQKASVMFVTGG